jgi:hypothetical protein
MDFSVDDAKKLLEKYLKEEHDGITVKEYLSVSDATGEPGAKTRTLSVVQSDDNIRHYTVDQRGSELTLAV